MSYFYVGVCPLFEDCSESKAGTNKHFWGATEAKCKAKVLWHLQKSKFHENLSLADAKNIVELCDIEYKGDDDVELETKPKDDDVAPMPSKKPRLQLGDYDAAASSASSPASSPARHRAAASSACIDMEISGNDIITLVANAADGCARAKLISENAGRAFVDVHQSLMAVKKRLEKSFGN